MLPRLSTYAPNLQSFGKSPEISAGRTLLPILALASLLSRLPVQSMSMPTMQGRFSIADAGFFDNPGMEIPLAILAAGSLLLLGLSLRRMNRRGAILRASELRYRTLAEAADDIMFVLDLKGCVQYVNNVGLLRLGKTEKEIIGKKPEEILPEDVAPGMWETTQKMMEGGSVFYSENDITFTGGRRWIGTRLTPIRNNEGTITAVLGIARDITEKKESEEQLRLMAQTIASARDCVSITDLNDRILYVNAAFLQTYGYVEPELLGKNIREMVAVGVSPRAMGEILSATIAGGWHGEIINKKKDGAKFPVELWTSIVKNDIGNPVALVGVARDITERKKADESLRRSEEQFRSLFEESKDGVFFNSIDGKVIDINPAGVTLFGYSSKEELQKLSVAEDIYWDPPRREDFIRVLKRQGYVQDYEVELKRKDGTKVTVLETATSVRDEQGNFIAYRGIVRDISEQKKTQREREKLITELQEALASIKQLSGLLPICASCKKIRDDSGYWTQVEKYITVHSEATFSHGLCPECIGKFFPDMAPESEPQEKQSDG